MTRGRMAGAGVLLLAIACLAGAVRETYRVLEPALRWTAVDACVKGTRLGWEHDGQGVLVFSVEAKLAYSCGDRPVEAVLKSDFRTYKFALARALMRRLPAGSSTRVYCNPRKPDEARFALDYSKLYRGPPALLTASFFFLTFLAVRLWKHWRPAAMCRRCKSPLKAHYRFCPHCRASLSSSSHLIAHDSAS